MTERGGIEADIDCQVKGKCNGSCNHEQVADAQGGVDDIDIRQEEEHEACKRPADEYEGPPPSSPEPDPVADEPDDHLPDYSRQRSGSPDDSHLMNIQMILRGQKPAQG